LVLSKEQWWHGRRVWGEGMPSSIAWAIATVVGACRGAGQARHLASRGMLQLSLVSAGDGE